MTSAFILEKIKRLQVHADTTPVLCSVCQLPLTDPISKEAGKGPTCSRRIRFTEKLASDQLNEMEGQSISLNEGNVVKTVIVRLENEQNPRFITVVSNDQNSVDFWDHNECDSLYENGASVTESVLRSWHQAPNQSFKTVSTLVEPKNKTFAESLKLFEDSYKEELKSRDKDSKASSGVRIQSRKFLDKKQVQERSNLIKDYRSTDNSNFKEKLNSGEYPIATLMSRLASSTLPGANDLLLALSSYNKNITPMDHGLTDDEMLHSLTHAVKPIEKKIFNAVIKGKCKLEDLAKAYKTIKDNPTVIENFQKFNELAR
jgi:hypothetical protein